MPEQDFVTVTGAFGYTGRYIAKALLARGEVVKTLTNRPADQNPFPQPIPVLPFDFNNPSQLTESLRGASVLYNTYWVRFNYGATTFARAVENSKTLINAARQAGVSRIVHISITSADASSHLPYFSGKGLVEDAIKDSGLSYAILRPTVIFGHEDILIKNIAWALRRFPVFPIPGDGQYKIQPVFVEDVAGLAVEAANQPENLIIDAVGPETFTFDSLVRLVMAKIGARAAILHVPPALMFTMTSLVGRLTRDVILTREEINGLMAGLLISHHPSTGKTSFSQWVNSNAADLGLRYASELGRHFRKR